MKHFARALVLTVLFLLPGVARADEPAKPEWYGWQTLAADSASLLVGVALSGKSDAGAALAIGGYAVGGPMIHIAHHNPGKAGGSFLLRVAAPLTLGFLGYEAFGGSKADNWGPAIGAVGGLGLGAVLASLVDAGALAWDKPRPSAAARLSPTVSAGPRGGMIGIGGVL